MIVRKSSPTGVSLLFEECSSAQKQYKAVRYHAFRLVEPTLNLGVWSEKVIRREGTNGTFKSITLQRQTCGMKIACLRHVYEVKRNEAFTQELIEKCMQKVWGSIKNKENAQ